MTADSGTLSRHCRSKREDRRLDRGSEVTGGRRISAYLSLHLSDPMERRLSLGQEDSGEGNAGVSDRHDKVQRERRAGGKPRPRQVGIVFSIHPESVQLWGIYGRC